MRHFPKWAIFIVLGIFLVVYFFMNGTQSYRYNDITKSMNEAMQIAVTKSIDKSVRADPGEVALVQNTFEDTFKAQFAKTNTKMSVQKYTFDYLKTSDGFLKAVKVEVTDDQGTTYKTVYAADTDS